MRRAHLRYPFGGDMVQSTTLQVAGMTCGSCVRHVERALEGMTGVIDVSVDLARGQVSIEHLPEWADTPSLVEAVRQAGYEARLASGDVYTESNGRSSCCGGG